MESNRKDAVNEPGCSDPVVHELGRMVVLFQDLDHDLRECVHWLLFPEDAGRGDDQVHGDEVAALTSGMSFKALVDVCFSLYAVKDKAPETPLIAELRSALSAAEEKRNTFLHSHWFGSNGEMRRSKTSARARGGVKRHAAVVSLKEIQEINQQLERTQGIMFEFLTERIYGL